MPHLVVEYSANLEGRVDVDGLLDRLYAVAIETGLFPIGGIRIRAYRAELYRIADLGPDNAFVHVTAMVGSGRTLDQRRGASDLIFAALCEALAAVQAASPLAISFNMQEFDPVLNYKKNNLHEYVEKRSRVDPTR
jgi:5-carboxymethyl-2-hydroxymuconate isomerase